LHYINVKLYVQNEPQFQTALRPTVGLMFTINHIAHIVHECFSEVSSGNAVGIRYHMITMFKK